MLNIFGAFSLSLSANDMNYSNEANKQLWYIDGVAIVCGEW